MTSSFGFSDVHSSTLRTLWPISKPRSHASLGKLSMVMACTLAPSYGNRDVNVGMREQLHEAGVTRPPKQREKRPGSSRALVAGSTSTASMRAKATLGSPDSKKIRLRCALIGTAQVGERRRSRRAACSFRRLAGRRATGRQRGHLKSAVRNQHRMFPLRRQAVIGGDRCPADGASVRMPGRPALIIGSMVNIMPGNKPHTGTWFAVVKDLRLFVVFLANPVPAKLTNDGVSPLAPRSSGSRDQYRRVSPRFDHTDAAPQYLVGGLGRRFGN